ncbi:conserved exported hypothetical protein [Flavobacterium sp. 9AF]|uniref:hypothetical protein n=1 Tax=Flavobacterium sp. 9AF TaxID=2653142 RepID=UPI0012F3EB86|nr:hypothetical protein [Flavobacterium sp. 9AF]VXB14375.1 conserved exported hypothetical protein [Flavobacterium sp. 9AF]
MKKNKKVSFVILLSSIFIFSIILFSCSDDTIDNDKNSSGEEILKIIEKKTGFIKVTNANEINIISKNLNYNSNTVFYKSIKENNFIIISSNDNNYFLNKGSIENGKFIVKNRFELVDNMNDEGNGDLIIKNLDEGIVISQTYSDGVFKNVLISSNEELSSKGLCQREKGESFKDCNSRETDEFCDDFVSTVAYITNPSIAILIAALCSC